MNKTLCNLVRIVATIVCGLPMLAVAEDDPQWKVRIDPALALADYPNVEVDRQVADDVSVGLMLWHNAADYRYSEDQTSAGIRLDWFDREVFTAGWHTNLILKTDWNDAEFSRWRLKGTQTYQWAWNEFFLNAGIGVQWVKETESQNSGYYDYESWLLPAWEVSVGRSF